MTPAEMAALHAASFTTPRPWSLAEIGGLLQSPLVFACSDSQGFAMGRVVAGEAEVLTLAVAPQARREGLGARLLAAVLAEAKARGAEMAFLEVASGNAAARALYGRAGFAESGRRRAYYRAPDGTVQDALIMSCAL